MTDMLRTPPAPRRHLGFTLIEAMVAIAIIGILATLAGPSLTIFIETQRIKAAASDLQLALLRARSEAIKQNRQMTLTPASDGWVAGWSLNDPDTNAPIDQHGAVTNLSISGGPTSITYRASGRVTSATAIQFTISGTSSTVRRYVCVDLTGRPLIKDSAC